MPPHPTSCSATPVHRTRRSRTAHARVEAAVALVGAVALARGTMSSLVVGFISGLFGGGEIEIEGEISDDDDGAPTPRGDAEAPRQTTPFSETGRRRAAAGPRARALLPRALQVVKGRLRRLGARHAGALAAAAVVQKSGSPSRSPEKQRAPAENGGGGGGSSSGKRFAAEVALRRCLSMPELCLYGVHPLIGGAADADESFGEPREALGISHARDRHGNKYMNQISSRWRRWATAPLARSTSASTRSPTGRTPSSTSRRRRSAALWRRVPRAPAAAAAAEVAVATPRTPRSR